MTHATHVQDFLINKHLGLVPKDSNLSLVPGAVRAVQARRAWRR